MHKSTRVRPSYLTLSESEFERRIAQLYERLKHCDICPRRCGVDRTKNEKGFCRSGLQLKIASFFPHLGEEPPLRGTHGSGTVFLSNCNLHCVYCQNWEISQRGTGDYYTEAELARIMLRLQHKGCHNINFVTPTHFTPQIVKAVKLAAADGLRIPLVWNTSSYEAVETLRLLDGIVDIYLPDVKYADDENARKYSAAPRYFEIAQAAVREMHRQVGDLQIDEHGLAVRGLLIRHLVLPDNLAGSERVLRFIAELSRESYVNIMDQYYPTYRAFEYPELARRITAKEYQQVLELARRLGLHRGLPQHWL